MARIAITQGAPLRVPVSLAVALVLSAVFHTWLLGGISVLRFPEGTEAANSLSATLEPAPIRVRQTVEPRHKPAGPAASRPVPAQEASAQPSAEQTVAAPAESAQTEMPAMTPDTADGKPALQVPTIVDATVYPPHELDEFPVPLRAVVPSYPEQARADGTAGRVTLELAIDESGQVREARIVDANPPEVFDTATLEAYQSARYRPAQREGRAVRSRIAIQVEFAPGEAGAKADRPIP